MATDNQIEANRRNAQHCTGPKTDEGKARSSQNALKTGLYSKAEVLATESREDYEALAADYYDHFAPANPHERSLVDALLRYEWLSRRYMAADTAVWNNSLEDEKPNVGRAFVWHSETLSRAGRYFNQARKGFSATLKELKALQAERKSEEAERKSEHEHSPLPSRGCEGAVTQRPIQQDQPLTPTLVSFRQTAEITQPLAAPTEETEETPPLAA